MLRPPRVGAAAAVAHGAGRLGLSISHISPRGCVVDDRVRWCRWCWEEDGELVPASVVVGLWTVGGEQVELPLCPACYHDFVELMADAGIPGVFLGRG